MKMLEYNQLDWNGEKIYNDNTKNIFLNIWSSNLSPKKSFLAIACYLVDVELFILWSFQLAKNKHRWSYIQEFCTWYYWDGR